MDADLKAAVDKGAQVIRGHMNMIDKMAKDRGLATPGRGSKAGSSASQ